MTSDGNIFTDKTNEVVNGWLQEALGVPITISANRLALRVVAALEDMYEIGRQDGIDGRNQMPEDDEHEH